MEREGQREREQERVICVYKSSCSDNHIALMADGWAPHRSTKSVRRDHVVFIVFVLVAAAAGGVVVVGVRIVYEFLMEAQFRNQRIVIMM